MPLIPPPTTRMVSFVATMSDIDFPPSRISLLFIFENNITKANYVIGYYDSRIESPPHYRKY